jgi:hypothetical protein
MNPLLVANKPRDSLEHSNIEQMSEILIFLETLNDFVEFILRFELCDQIVIKVSLSYSFIFLYNFINHLKSFPGWFSRKNLKYFENMNGQCFVD